MRSGVQGGLSVICTSTLPDAFQLAERSLTSWINSGPKGQAGVVIVIMTWMFGLAVRLVDADAVDQAQIDHVDQQFRVADLLRASRTVEWPGFTFALTFGRSKK